ncbi:Hypothetical_protein [Hexamita inflata]|uniref:Hypothetical_protein n=1 Tax=Hexamita inflata TaxID=28002 RepID=A0AA86NQU1_9EUKA|nr:Hypothetical protein HINF_LOCUS10781 [Hexamita inflata]
MDILCAVCRGQHYTTNCTLMRTCAICTEYPCQCGYQQQKNFGFAKRTIKQQTLTSKYEKHCYKCGQYHIPQQCELRQLQAAKSQINETACINCGSRRHQSAECSFELQNQLEYGVWFTYQEMQDMQ